MARDNEGRRRPRRPQREESRDPAEIKEKIDREFGREIEMRIGYFLQSEERELDLEPMNSYRRRMVHTIAKKFTLDSESRGEDRERYVCLLKTQETTQSPPPSRARMWDFGSQNFNVNPGQHGIRMALKIDGSVEIWRASEQSHIITDRVVTTQEFRIRQGKIVMPGEAGY